MNNPSQTYEHDEVGLLLPWYVNDTLDTVEQKRVENHLATCTECQDSVALLSDVQAAVARNKATPIVPQPRVNDLLESLNKGNLLRNAEHRDLKTFFAAAAITLLLIATLLVSNPDDRTGTLREYETATSTQDGASMEYVLRIQFESGISRTTRERILQDMGARDISGSIDEDSYRVIVQLTAASLDELARYTGNLEALPEVSSVNVVALQLPVNMEQ